MKQTQALSSQLNDRCYVGKRQLAEITGISPHTWKEWRRRGLLIEDVHWLRISKTCVLFCLPLVLDWLHNRSDPPAHQRAIENYQARLLSNQSKFQRQSYSNKGR